jgi:hypothetical protein
MNRVLKLKLRSIDYINLLFQVLASLLALSLSEFYMQSLMYFLFSFLSSVVLNLHGLGAYIGN